MFPLLDLNGNLPVWLEYDKSELYETMVEQQSGVLLCRDKLAKMAKDNRNRAGISLRLIRQPHMGLVI